MATLGGAAPETVDSGAEVEGTFSVTVAGGAKQDGRRYTLVSLNMPVAAHPRQMGLVRRDKDGNQTLVDKNGHPVGRFHAGNGMTRGDLMWIYDSATGSPRNGEVVYLTTSGEWKMRGGGNVPEGYFKPNDVIVILSLGNSSGGKVDDWVWTYSPSEFYDLPTRWMGR